jgi:hypothetical protein
MSNTAKNLTQEPPRSPRIRLGGYLLAARMIDKGRAHLNGTLGEYHFNCTLDNILFKFKGITGEEVEMFLTSGASDEQIVEWMHHNGTPRTDEEVTRWSDLVLAEKSAFFDFLESDDQVLLKRINTSSRYVTTRKKSIR